MYGNGWKCDECGSTAVVTAPEFSYEPQPPEGWWQVTGPMADRDDPNGHSRRREFCSAACLASWLARQGLYDPDDPERPM